jgi:hypothetical protein
VSISTCKRILACLHVITLSLTDRAKQCFEVNYFGSMRLIQTFLPALREAPGRGARIVQISSLAGLLTSPGVAVCTFGWEKSPQPTRDAHQSVSRASHCLTDAPLGYGGGASLLARAGTLLCAQLPSRLVLLRCTPEPSLPWRPWARRFDWSSRPPRFRSRPSTPVACAQRS